MTIVYFLACLALIMTLCVLLYLPKLLKLKFYPSYSSFTFPFVISAIGLKLTNGFLIKANKGIEGLKYIVKFEEFLAIILVLFVLFRYIKFLFAKEQTSKTSTTLKA